MLTQAWQNLVDVPTWQDYSLCQEYDPQIFIPKSDEFTKRQKETARAICDQCPVKSKCLDWILNLEAEIGRKSFGMWGGLTPEERTKIRRCRLKSCRKTIPDSAKANNFATLYCSEKCSTEAKKSWKQNQSAEPPREYFMRGKIHG